MDNHLQEIINSSFRSLVCIRLQSCRYIRKFYDIGRCTQLRALFITENSYLTPYSAISPTTTSDWSQNRASTSNSLICLAVMVSTRASSSISASLKTWKLTLNNYQQPLGDVQCLKPLAKLEEISLQNSCVFDMEVVLLVKSVESLSRLNISGCQLLTDFCLESILSMQRCQALHVEQSKTKFGQPVLDKLRKYNI